MAVQRWPNRSGFIRQDDDFLGGSLEGMIFRDFLWEKVTSCHGETAWGGEKIGIQNLATS